jgi:hypothetical protein
MSGTSATWQHRLRCGITNIENLKRMSLPNTNLVNDLCGQFSMSAQSIRPLALIQHNTSPFLSTLIKAISFVESHIKHDHCLLISIASHSYTRIIFSVSSYTADLETACSGSGSVFCSPVPSVSGYKVAKNSDCESGFTPLQVEK